MRVWVTRDEEPDGPLSTALRTAGLTAVHEPVLTRHVLNDAGDAIGQLGPDDWLVLTSVYAVEAVATDPARIPRVAVVSEVSRRAAHDRGFRVELVSADGGAKALFAELRSKVSTGKVCYPRSSLARPPEPWPGIQLISPVLYETTARVFDRTVITRVDIVSVASPSAVETILLNTEPRASARADERITADPSTAPPGGGGQRGGGVQKNSNEDAGSMTRPISVALRELPFASIGPTTSNALRRIGIEPAIEASERSFDSLARAIAARRSRPN